MNIVWVGFHFEGLPAFKALLSEGIKVKAVMTLTKEDAANRSGVISYSPLCAQFQVPIYEIHHINSPDSTAILKNINPDIVFVIGWSQILSEDIVRIPRIGMIGAHASLLPHNRGSAPINWAIINGETETGNTLMWLNKGVDEGEIIDQMRFPITPFDSCSTLYQHVAETNKIMILKVLKKLILGERPGRQQPPIKEAVLPRRRPQDGIINWKSSNVQIYDFIRGVTKPYPGAFTYLDRNKIIIWKAALLPNHLSATKPGRIIGPTYSPVDDACGIIVECGTGCILITEIERKGLTIKGRSLAMTEWNGRTFKNEQ